MQKMIQNVRPGETVEFKKYALRVESVDHGRGSTTLRGRISIDGSPLVKKTFLNNRPVRIR